MAPPPNSGDATNKHENDDDPLGGMDPMAWLESLAARQGAKPEELVTAANLDIPLPPAERRGCTSPSTRSSPSSAISS